MIDLQDLLWQALTSFLFPLEQTSELLDGVDILRPLIAWVNHFKKQKQIDRSSFMRNS